MEERRNKYLSEVDFTKENFDKYFNKTEKVHDELYSQFSTNSEWKLVINANKLKESLKPMLLNDKYSDADKNKIQTFLNWLNNLTDTIINK